VAVKFIKPMLLSLFSLAVLNSCNSAVSILNEKVNTLSVDNQLTQIYPLKTGLTWNYDLEQFQNDQPATKFKEMTITVVNNDNNTALLKRFYPNSAIQPNQTLATIYPDHIDLSRYVQQSVFESFGSAFKEGKDFITILQSPLESGQSWEGRIFQGGSEKLVVSGREKVNVPAGVFNALKIWHHLTYDNGKEDNLYYWYAEGTGTVKMHEEITFNLSGQWVKLKSIGVLKGFSNK
jgi:hypothetical protein